jgi:hypothetical protein
MNFSTKKELYELKLTGLPLLYSAPPGSNGISTICEAEKTKNDGPALQQARRPAHSSALPPGMPGAVPNQITSDASPRPRVLIVHGGRHASATSSTCSARLSTLATFSLCLLGSSCCYVVSFAFSSASLSSSSSSSSSSSTTASSSYATPQHLTPKANLGRIQCPRSPSTVPKHRQAYTRCPWPPCRCLMLTAYCLLLTAYCLLLTA